MIDHLPDRLDLFAAAAAGCELQGRILLNRLERVLPSLLSSDGELQVTMKFGKDEDGTHYLSGTIQGNTVLECQRCLGSMNFPLELKFRLGLVHDHESAKRLPEKYEPLLLTGEPACIADVISDEVLLALPFVSLHDANGECRELLADYQAPEIEQRTNPFAVLKQLKQK